jgi:hypothetical protein
MKIVQSYVQKAKIVFHIIQAFLIFIAGCITLSVFTKGGFVGGGPKWFFALVCSSGYTSQTRAGCNVLALSILQLLF